MFCSFCFFFNYTATTEIYTYVHTLSLHDALPIFFFIGHRVASSISRWRMNVLMRAIWRRTFCISAVLSSCPVALRKRRLSAPCFVSRNSSMRSPRRSEEHTSELQSLMRISYAVFCLKKKHDTLDTEKINIR